MLKILFLLKNYKYKACTPTILNLSINLRRDKFRIVRLEAQVNYIICVLGLLLYVYFVVTRKGLLVVVDVYCILNI
jgi:hypothetical protein